MYISVIIPAYNASKFIKEAIDSCLIQKEVGEVIVVDDLSIDNTIELVEEFKDIRVKLIKSLTRGGPSAAINKGIEYAKCSLLTVLGADDYFKVNRFEENVEFLMKNLEIDGTYEAVQNFFESDAKYSTEHDVDVILLQKTIAPKDLFSFLIRDKEPYFSIISVLYKNRYDQNIYNDLDLRYGQDIDFTYQLAKSYTLVKLEKPHPMIMRRLHGNNNTSNHDFTKFNVRKRILYKWYGKAKDYKLPFRPTIFLIYRMACHKYLEKFENTPIVFGYFIKLLFVFKLIIQDFIISKVITSKLQVY